MVFLNFLGLAVVVLVGAMLFDFANFMDFHRQIYKHKPGICKRVEGDYFGAEDFQILSNGLAFITSGIATKHFSVVFWDFVEKNNVRGQILMMDLNLPDNSIREVRIRPSEKFDVASFRPHGLSVLEDKVNGGHLVYVVNHVVTEDDRIEKFRFIPETVELEHLRSFSSSLMTNINDVTVIAEDRFYVTNWAYYSNYLMVTIEQLFRLPWHSLVYFNGTDFRVAVNRLVGPNGVIASRDGNHIYVGMFLSKGIKVYERSVKDDSLELVQDVYLGTGVDNFHLSEDGDALFTGSHPLVANVTSHLDDPSLKAPSQVLRFPLKGGLIVKGEITELLSDDGNLLSASTVATVYKNKLYVGSFIDKILICELNN